MRGIVPVPSSCCFRSVERTYSSPACRPLERRGISSFALLQPGLHLPAAKPSFNSKTAIEIICGLRSVLLLQAIGTKKVQNMRCSHAVFPEFFFCDLKASSK